MDNFQLKEGIHLHIHSLNKFRTAAVQVSFSMPLAEGRAVTYLLSALLGDTCEKYCDKLMVQKRLDELYGASLSIENKPVGALNRMRFSISGCDAESVQEDLLPGMFETLSEFILHPRLENGVFPMAMFEECRDQALMAVRMMKNDPFTYAGRMAVKAYGANPVKRMAPEEETLLAMTPEDCVSAWKKMIETARIDINVLGNVKNDEVIRLCGTCLPLAARKTCVHAEEFNPAEVSVVKAERDIPQVHIMQFYDTGLLGSSPLTPALFIGNGILGGLSTGFLFQNIREKQGLCYSIDSVLMPNDGILRLSAAVNPDDLDALLASVEQETSRLGKMEFSDEDLQMAKRMYISSHLSSLDTPGAMLEEDYRQSVYEGRLCSEELIRAFQKVTKEDIAAAFANLKLKITAILGPGGNDVRE